MYYAEEWSHGRWRPVTYTDQPTVEKGRLKRVGAIGPRIQNVTEVPPESRDLSLSDLREKFGS